ncbi:MAG TPA: SCO family protein [Terriglobales bacterium]|nr:SCO family protein [Terriglobales bacterium]
MSSTVQKSLWTVAGVALLASTGWAQGMYSGAGGIMAPSANVKPPGLKRAGIEQKLDQQLPLNLVFRDEAGKPVKLGDFFGKRPVILTFVYFRCPMLCSEVLSGLEGSLKALSFDIGKDFDVLTVSFDPKDTPESATEKKASVLQHYKREGARDGWHFLTGSEESIAALTDAAGFGYDYDEKTNQFAHSTAIMVITPEGKIAQYYYGVDFPPRDLRLGLVQASQNKIGTLADQVLLYCYHYDPQSGRWGAVVTHMIQLGGGVTILALGAMLLVLLRRGSDSEHRGQGNSQAYVR